MSQSSGISRRQFIRITASAGLLIAGGAGVGLLKGLGTGQRVSETRMLMGSIAHLDVVSDDPVYAREAIVAALDTMSALEDVFSRFRPASQLSRLNADGVLRRPHPAFVDVLSTAVRFGDLTGGAFDVTIEPVLRVYREAALAGTLPDLVAVAAARERVDYRRIRVAAGEIRLTAPGMAVTLDGIAKGYIIDAGTAVLKRLGFDHVMVEVGGDLQTVSSAGRDPWRIEIQRPRPASPQMYARLDGRAIATSGDYQYTFSSDLRAHHIVDPHSGVSPDELAGASVIAPTACEADALSTALMVMGAREGLVLAGTLPDVDALVISKLGTVAYSPGFPLG
ncbi:MAG: FAD:protein FMN transferase [Chloroflexi bacterium]|nr:FAD:protein FMN transferase [Chloroflexota bacterium]